MLARSVIGIIENMGFVREDSVMTANFLCDATGNILTITAYVGADECGLQRILFNAYDDHDNLLSTSTLDQIMLEYERGHITLVPTKSNKKYRVTMSAKIDIVVDMDAVFPETYRMYIEDGYTEETEIVNSVAKCDVTEYCNGAPFTVTDIDFESIEEITK